MQASAPGKVLILGGYLIVQAPNAGISIGVNARFTTQLVSASPVSTPGETVVRVESPQFHTNFLFVCHTANGVVSVEQKEGPESPFLKYAVLYSVAAACNAGDDVRKDLSLRLLADNDFYSQRNFLEEQGKPVNTANLRALPKHLPLVGKVSKTGLGSSAAMTTSVVACLYGCGLHQKPVEKELLHRIAQVAHSVAQGKIGSGFDVFTAVYGTCVYRRFPASKAEMMMTGEERPKSVEVASLARCVDMSQEWVKNVPFRLPEGLKLVLGDIHFGGSSTPGMVAKIMSWQKSVAGRPGNLFDALRENNEVYISHLRALVEQASTDPQSHQAALDALKRVQLMQHEPANDAERRFTEAAHSAAKSRELLRSMGVAAEVKVEPEELTGLLNETAALPGVFAVGCPGAGGYDAVFALVLGEETCAAVEAFWEGYTKMNVCPLLVREDPSGLEVSMGPKS